MTSGIASTVVFITSPGGVTSLPRCLILRISTPHALSLSKRHDRSTPAEHEPREGLGSPSPMISASTWPAGTRNSSRHSVPTTATRSGKKPKALGGLGRLAPPSRCGDAGLTPHPAIRQRPRQTARKKGPAGGSDPPAVIWFGRASRPRDVRAPASPDPAGDPGGRARSNPAPVANGFPPRRPWKGIVMPRRQQSGAATQVHPPPPARAQLNAMPDMLTRRENIDRALAVSLCSPSPMLCSVTTTVCPGALAAADGRGRTLICQRREVPGPTATTTATLDSTGHAGFKGSTLPPLPVRNAVLGAERGSGSSPRALVLPGRAQVQRELIRKDGFFDLGTGEKLCPCRW